MAVAGHARQEHDAAGSQGLHEGAAGQLPRVHVAIIAFESGLILRVVEGGERGRRRAVERHLPELASGRLLRGATGDEIRWRQPTCRPADGAGHRHRQHPRRDRGQPHRDRRQHQQSRQHQIGIGAGDQGLMFGYATNETDVLMPAPITYAHRLVERQAEVRKNGTLPWLRPDAKSQVTFQYDDGKIVGIDAVVLSTQHAEDIDQKSLQEAVMEEIIKPVLPTEWLSSATKFFINPTGRFVIGGPMGDCGLTGRKIIVDTYGGMARHGGGAFSGKDPSKVDRSAAYAARYVAKNIVAAGLADRCEIQVSYAIGVAEPTSIMVETFGTEKVPSEQLTLLVREFFDLRPYGLIQMLDLLHPIYKETAAYGHFGREHFPWEKTDKAALLREAAGLK